MNLTTDIAPTPTDPAQPLPSPDQVAAIVAEAKVVIATIHELATLVALARQHDLPALLGELRAAFGMLGQH